MKKTSRGEAVVINRLQADSWIASNQATWQVAGVLVYALVLAAALYIGFSHWGYDDPFITYRYAANLSGGMGMVYNPGERVLSTTTPLFALLLSLLAKAWPDLPRLAVLMGAASLALGGVFLWDLGRTWKTPLIGWAGLLLYPVFSLVVNTLGSETPLYLALCLGAFAFFARKCYAWAGLFSGLAVLARPDGILAPALLGFIYILQERLSWQRDTRTALRSVPWKAVAIFFAITLAWFGFAWYYFGSPLPVTLAAKQGQGAMAISERFAPGFFSIIKWYTAWHYKLEASLAVAGVGLLLWRARPWAAILGWTVLYFAAYSFLGVSRYFWYYAPLVPGFVVAAGAGLSLLGLLVSRALKDPVQRWKPAEIFTYGVLVILALAHVNGLVQMRLRPDNRLAIYRAAGEWLNANTEADDSVGALEVGIIGYYARRPMIDFAGLIQPEVAAQFKENTTYQDTAVWAFERYHPNYLVVMT
ncbi:MAG: hypothetical protein EHM70_11710, partial [Chloroflexota bacterium]